MSLVVQDPRPYFLWDTAQTISVTVEQAGQVVTPSAGTIKIIDDDGDAVYLDPPTNSVTEASCTTLGGGTTSATYRIIADVFDGVSATTRYTARWALTIGGDEVKIEREIFIGRLPVYPPITWSDLVARHSALSDSRILPTNKASGQDYVDEAWNQGIARMLASAVPPTAVTSWYSFREPLLRMAEAAIANDLRSTRSGATKWQDLWEGLMSTAEDPRSIEFAWGQMAYRADRDEDGVPDADGKDELRPGQFHSPTAEPGGGRFF